MTEQIVMWLLGVGGVLFATGIFHVLNTINSSIKELNSTVVTVANNLARLDRRVAYLEGRYDGGREKFTHPKGDAECQTH